MCVLILHHRLIPGYPIIVAANRDEARDRASDSPFLWPQGFLAPRDRKAGGTWIGINRNGLFAGLTNRARPAPDPGRQSRGELVVEALTAPAARTAVMRVERAFFAAPRNPFNMLIADANEAFLVVGAQDTNVRPLEPGTHVLTNQHELGGLALGNVTPPADIEAALDQLGGLVREHDKNGYAICKHGDRYGTVSSALLAAGEDENHPDRFAFADGLPCQKQHLELKEQIRSMHRVY